MGDNNAADGHTALAAKSWRTALAILEGVQHPDCSELYEKLASIERPSD